MRDKGYSARRDRSRNVAEIHDAPEHHHLAGGIPGSQSREVRGFFAKRQIRLRGDVIRAAEKIEVVDVGGAEVSLDRFGDVLYRHAELLRLDAIDFDEHLRRIRGEWRKYRGQTMRLARRRYKFVGRRGQQLGPATLSILDTHAEAAASTDARHRGRWNDNNERALKRGQALAQLPRDRCRGQSLLQAHFRLFEHREQSRGIARLRSGGA